MSELEMKKSSGKATKILLVGSLALNLLIIGIVAGVMITGGPGGPGGGPKARNIGFGPFTDALSGKDRRELRDALRDEQRQNRTSPQAMRATFDEILDAIKAEPFDIETARSAFVAQQSILQNRQNLGVTVLLQRIAEMSAEERQEFAVKLEENLAKNGANRPVRKKN